MPAPGGIELLLRFKETFFSALYTNMIDQALLYVKPGLTRGFLIFATC